MPPYFVGGKNVPNFIADELREMKSLSYMDVCPEFVTEDLNV